MSLVQNIQSLLKSNFSEYTYLRATSGAEADILLSQSDLKNKPVILFYNVPEITVTQGVSNLEESYPVQIMVGYQLDIDASGDEKDEVFEACKAILDKFWDLLLQDANFQKIVQTKQGDNVYNLIPVASLEIGGENITGYRLETDIKLHRSSQTLDT